jgi:hypothetical protein
MIVKRFDVKIWYFDFYVLYELKLTWIVGYVNANFSIHMNFSLKKMRNSFWGSSNTNFNMNTFDQERVTGMEESWNYWNKIRRK